MAEREKGKKQCAAINCSVYEGERSFHRFPKNHERCMKWVSNARLTLGTRTSRSLNGSSRLCSKHFEDNQFNDKDRTALKWNAIPTIFDIPNLPPGPTLKRKLLTHSPSETRAKMANTPAAQIQSVTGDSPAANFVKSADYHEVRKNVEELKKPVVLIYGTSGQGKKQIGRHIMNERSVDGDCRVFFFNTQTNDSYIASYSVILKENGCNQDSEWTGDSDRSEDYDFLKLCRYISKKRRSPNPENILFFFDDLSDDNGRPTGETQQWITKFYKMIKRFSSSAPAKMQLIVTVPMKPHDKELRASNNVYIHTMQGFTADDIKTFLRRSLSSELPEFLETRVQVLSEKMGNSPEVYMENLKEFQSMASERELDDFLEVLDKRKTNGPIKQRLHHLNYLEIWMVMTNFARMNIPSELFYAVLVYCRETGNLGLSRDDIVGEIFSIMKSEFLRCNFITEVRVGSNNQQIDWTIRTEVHNCLNELVRDDTEERRQTFLTIGLMAMASIVDRDDRFHSDKRQCPHRHINMLSQTNAVYDKITESDGVRDNLPPFQKVAVYQLLTGIYSAKLNKVGSDLQQHDLEAVYKSILELEALLSSPGAATGGQRGPSEDESPAYNSDATSEPDPRSRYESMRTYFPEKSKHECDIALGLYHSNQQDQKPLEDCLRNRKRKIERFTEKHQFGMLTEEQLKRLRDTHFILGYGAYRQVFPLEILARMYIILGMMRQRVDNMEGETEFWAQSPRGIFNYVDDNIFKVIEEAAKKDVKQQVANEIGDTWEIEQTDETYRKKYAEHIFDKRARLDKLKKICKDVFEDSTGDLLKAFDSALEFEEKLLTKPRGAWNKQDGFTFFNPYRRLEKLVEYKTEPDRNRLQGIMQKLVEQHGENAMFKDLKCLQDIVNDIKDGKMKLRDLQITEDMLAVSDKLISAYAQEGTEYITQIKIAIQMLYKNTEEKLDSWKEYSSVMAYVGRLMIKCRQMLEGLRYYTYALRSLYEYTDKKKEQLVTDQLFIKLCTEVIKLATRPPTTFPGLAAQPVGEELKGQCICFPESSGDDTLCGSCSNHGLFENFLHGFEGIETRCDEERKAIDILVTNMKAPVPPVDDAPAEETAI